MIGRDSATAVVAVLANSVMWIAQTEQIWFPMAAAYVRYLGPIYGLPDLRGPLAFITLLYLGLRLGDFLNARKEVGDTLEDMT